MIYITSRAEVAVDYVLHPGENVSIELTALVGLEDSSLTFWILHYFRTTHASLKSPLAWSSSLCISFSTSFSNICCSYQSLHCCACAPDHVRMLCSLPECLGSST